MVVLALSIIAGFFTDDFILYSILTTDLFVFSGFALLKRSFFREKFYVKF